MVMAKILGSLPPKYHSFISAWESAPETNQTLNNLRERLLREEGRLNNSEDVNRALASMSISNETSKEKVQHTDGNKNHNGNKKRVTCNFCKKPGHLGKYCFAKKRQSRNAEKNSKELNNKREPDGE
uniref:CCHC-type domain-containing protein n=1 Tax=Trichogramma kaykai TaxID=54128 RepID=A0ABD2W2W9_9HYME